MLMPSHSMPFPFNFSLFRKQHEHAYEPRKVLLTTQKHESITLHFRSCALATIAVWKWIRNECFAFGISSRILIKTGIVQQASTVGVENAV
jgi:hypothetical protein